MSTLKSRPPVGQSPVRPGTDRLVLLVLQVLLLMAVFFVAWLAISGGVLALGDFRRGVEPGFWLLTHRWASYGLTVVAIVAAPVGLSMSMFRLRLAPVAATTAAILVAIALGSTGRWIASVDLLNSDGAERSFLGWLFRPGIRFFVLGEGELSPTRLRVLALFHLVLLPTVLVTVGTWLNRSLRSKQP